MLGEIGYARSSNGSTEKAISNGVLEIDGNSSVNSSNGENHITRLFIENISPTNTKRSRRTTGRTTK